MKPTTTFFLGSLVGNIQVFVGLIIATRLGPVGAFFASIFIYWLGLYAVQAFMNKDKPDDGNQV